MAKREIYKVVFSGARDWSNSSAVRRELVKLIAQHGTTNLLIISGKAPGLDTMAKIQADNLSVHCAEIGALWETRYASAGPQRNKMMLALEPDEVIFFHKDISKSRGTKDCRNQAKKLGIKNKVVKK